VHADDLGPRREKRIKHVYRLLRKADVSLDLVDREVFVLWPDDGTWYRGRIEECTPKIGKAEIFYQETDEQEEADLTELIKDGQIAFSEP
jgi:hypothetical protein